MVTFRSSSMSDHNCWDCYRQVYPDSTPQCASRPSRVEYVQQVCRRYGVPEAGYYKWAAGRNYDNEACCMDACCSRDCRSFYGGYSSMLPKVVHCSTDGSLFGDRGTGLHANTSTINPEYWRDCHHRHAYPTSTAQYASTSGVEHVQESCCRQGPKVDFENDASFSQAPRKEQTQAVDAESYKGAAGWGNEAFDRTSSCRYDHGSSDGSNSSMFTKITDEPRLNGEVRKRTGHMDCNPHVPKINSRIPSADEATSDHERLLNRLELYNLHEFKVSGDGNCQFRALSDQLYQTSEYHKEVRQQVVDQLKANPDIYAPYVPMPYQEYLTKISTLGEWGDHVTLQAAADWYGMRIFVLTSYKDTCYMEILPRQQKSERVIYLSFWAEVHYNSIHSREGSLESYCHMSEPDRKKKWWNLMTQFQKK